MKAIKLSLRSVRARNERINGKKNAESLEFMEYVKITSTE